MSRNLRPLFPFSAIAGQEQMKLALVLNAINPAIGGVLISGTRGTAKSTAVRGLAEVLPPPTPFVNLPVGATEDRVLGTLDIEQALQKGERRFEPGLLAQAHNGILYIDEVNLLPDHLVDVILDTVAMGVNRVEREGISHEHAANIILIGTMNPEEGELRPQLLDRFGLCAVVESMSDSEVRKDAMRRRLAFDSDPARFSATFAAEQRALTERIARARETLGSVLVEEDLLDAIVQMAADAGADGLRADLSLHRAVRTLAAWEGRDRATEKDLETVAELALSHRRRRRDPRSTPPQQHPPQPPPGRPPAPGQPDQRQSQSPSRQDVVLGFGQARQIPWQERSQSRNRRGAKPAPVRGKGTRVASRGLARPSLTPPGAIAFPETLRTIATRRRGENRRPPLLPVQRSECVWRKRLQKRRRLIVFVVDSSGSMAAMARMRAAKAAVLGLLEKAYRHRCFVALVAFRKESADVLLHPTRSAVHAFRQLRQLPTGGTTPLADGLRTGSAVIRRSLEKDPSLEPLLVVITDGRATFPASNGFAEAAREAAAIAERHWPALCIDMETGIVRLGQAQALAALLQADYIHGETLPPARWAPIIEEWLSCR
jgi:magnesium chelatase subunit D